MAKLGCPKGGFDTFTATEPWSSSTSRASASQSPWKGCRTSLESLVRWNWGEQGCSAAIEVSQP